MKTEYKHISFVKVADKAKTSVWSCQNNHSGFKLGNRTWDRTELGIVRWYGPWRQYCYFATNGLAVYSESCLRDICSFLAELAEERKLEFVLHEGAGG